MDLQEKELASLKTKRNRNSQFYPKPSDLIMSCFMNEPVTVETFLEDL